MQKILPENLEKEAKFYFPNDELKNLHDIAIGAGLVFEGKFYELTRMFDNPNKEYSFYNPIIDGRLRFRVIKNMDLGTEKAKLSWKRRLIEHNANDICIQEEVEVAVSDEDILSMLCILEKVLKCPTKSSYERYRNVYLGSGVEFTIDEFPFGLMLEIEIKDGTEDDIRNIIKNTHLNKFETSKLSCDDMYRELCRREGIEHSSDIIFSDVNMPHIKRI